MLSWTASKSLLVTPKAPISELTALNPWLSGHLFAKFWSQAIDLL